MKPVVTVEEMRSIDRDSVVPETTLIERAGMAVASRAKRMLGGTYGRRVVVIAGKGNNGADGRVAADRLRRLGVRVDVVQPDVAHLPDCDLVIDAAYGTSFHGEWHPPYEAGVPILAVDVPSGVSGNDGTVDDATVRADVTVTFGALKPGLVLQPGAGRAGLIETVDIGLDTSRATRHVLESTDVFSRLPARAVGSSHKWQSAVGVVAGSAGMTGAAELCCRGAGRAGSGMVRLMVPGAQDWQLPSSEVVSKALPPEGWATEVMSETDRLRALVVGPGLGRSSASIVEVHRLVAESNAPLILDGDALFALSQDNGLDLLRKRQAPTVLTPHDGEFSYLTGQKPLAQRCESAKSLARETGSVVLLKGDTTVVTQGEAVLYCTTGSPRLATAGTGDVLAGVVGAFLAQGMEPSWAAAGGAYVHGAAAGNGHRLGLMAGDLPELIAQWLSVVGEGREGF